MLTVKESLKDLARWFFWYPLRKTIYLLPLKVNYAIANLMGIATYYIMEEKRELMRSELLNIFNGKMEWKDIKRILKKNFSIISKEKIEVLLFPKMNLRMVEKFSYIDGLENLNKALEEKKGAILLIAHFGNQRFIMPALGFRGYKINQIGAPPTVWKKIDKHMSTFKSKTLELELECEKSLPAKFIYYDKFMRAAFECLKRNEVLVIAADSVGGENKIEVDFLNRTALLSPGPFNIAKKSGAPVLPVFIIRDKNNIQTVKIEKRLDLSITNYKKEDELANMKKFIHVLENYVRKYPCHYLKHLWWVQTRRLEDPIPFFKISDRELNLVTKKISKARV